MTTMPLVYNGSFRRNVLLVVLAAVLAALGWSSKSVVFDRLSLIERDHLTISDRLGRIEGKLDVLIDGKGRR